MIDNAHSAPTQDDAIESLKLLESLGRPVLEEMAGSVEWVDLPEGGTLFRQGDEADSMFVVTAGMLHAFIADDRCGPTLVGEMGRGSLVGEIALLMGGRRNATVIAAAPTRLARLGSRDVEVILARHPHLRGGILDIVRRRLRRTQWLKILPAYFGGIDREMYALIEPLFQWVHVPRGGTLFTAGDPADAVFFLVHGMLSVVSRDPQGREKAIGSIYRGEIVGEMAVISGETRTATIRAARDSDLVRLTKDGFDRVSGVYPGVTMAILRIIVNRLRERTRPPRRSSAVAIAIVPAGPDVPLDDFSRRLQAALSCTDTAALLTSASVTAELGAEVAQASDDSPEHLGLLTWMEELETRNDFLLCQADAGPTPWTLRCVRQADQVLIVGRAGDDPSPGPLELRFLGTEADATGAARTLVLLHPDGSGLPTGTAAWLAARRVGGHVHLRWDRDADFARLARIVSRRAVGLVLGGGGARGMAHIGVLRALEERGIPVDVVGGTSIGAILGGLIAMGADSAGITRICVENFKKKNPFNDYSFPIVSVLRSGKIDKATRDAYGDAMIEDLWLAYFAVSTNLSSCDVRIHEAGLLRTAARTSSSLPGIMVPLVHDDAVHVDGGVMNNLPGDIMRRHAGLIITVDVDSRENMRPGLPAFPSSWRVLQSRIGPGKKRAPLPTVADIMMATIMTGSRKLADAVKADAELSLEPPVRGIGILDFKSLEQTAQAGYAYTLDMLDRLPPDSPLRAFMAQ
jgi:predicted acylesterase/phospholipase RssA/CRP-like cAMP-binding protein